MAGQLEAPVEVGFAMVGGGRVEELRETRRAVSLTGLPSEHAALLDGPVTVVLASRNPNGSRHLTPVCLGRDEFALYVAAGRGEVVDRNLRARPDVSFLLVDPADPYRWMDVSAHAEPVADEAERHDAQHNELLNQLGLPTATYSSTGMTGCGDGAVEGTYTLFRARPDRLTVYQKSRPRP